MNDYCRKLDVGSRFAAIVGGRWAVVRLVRGQYLQPVLVLNTFNEGINTESYFSFVVTIISNSESRWRHWQLCSPKRYILQRMKMMWVSWSTEKSRWERQRRPQQLPCARTHQQLRPIVCVTYSFKVIGRGFSNDRGQLQLKRQSIMLALLERWHSTVVVGMRQWMLRVRVGKRLQKGCWRYSRPAVQCSRRRPYLTALHCTNRFLCASMSLMYSRRCSASVTSGSPSPSPSPPSLLLVIGHFLQSIACRLWLWL